MRKGERVGRGKIKGGIDKGKIREYQGVPGE